MYNLFLQRQKTKTQHKINAKHNETKKYVENYCNKTRPQLLNNYQKRVNDFIRKIEHEPIVIGLPVNEKKNYRQQSVLKNKNSTFSQDQNLKQSLQTKYNQNVEMLSRKTESFKYKSSKDWTSLYNQLQRKQREQNEQFFKKHYGDTKMAFRSIGSQSKYDPNHQYRDRKQSLQINPPMRYTSKPTEQVLAKMKSKYSKKDRRSDMSKYEKSINNSNRDNHKLLKSSVNSVLGDDEANLKQNLSFGLHAESYDSISYENAQNNKDSQEEKRKKKASNKLYFKQMADLQQNIQDMKTKKMLRNLLYRCGVYKIKIKRSATQAQLDQFSQFQKVHNL